MRPLPPPNVPGDTEAERNNAVRKMFTLSKAAVLKREAEWHREQAREKRLRKAGSATKVGVVSFTRSPI